MAYIGIWHYRIHDVQRYAAFRLLLAAVHTMYSLSVQACTKTKSARSCYECAHSPPSVHSHHHMLLQHTYTHTRVNTHTCTYTHTHTHTYPLPHTPTPSHTPTHVTHTRTHKCTYRRERDLLTQPSIPSLSLPARPCSVAFLRKRQSLHGTRSGND